MDFLSNATPEMQLLLHCVWSPIPTFRSEDIPHYALQPGPDWDCIWQRAEYHGLLPLLYCGVQSCKRAVPERILSVLAQFHQANSRHNLAQTGELFNILRLLGSNGIEAVPFKGPVLSVMAYGDLSLRVFSDLDIFVCPESASRARDLLLADGYREYSLEPVPAQPDRFDPVRKPDMVLRHEERKTIVDLHSRLIGVRNCARMNDSFRSRLRPIQLAGRVVNTLVPEDLLLYLALHEAKHRWSRLEGMLSMARIAATVTGWPDVIQRAKAFGIERQLIVGLLAAAALFRTVFPDELRNRLPAHRGSMDLAREIAQNLLQPPSDVFDRVQAFSRAFRVRERWHDRLRLVGLQPNSRDQAFVPLPRYFRFLYWPIRPMRLINDYGGRCLRALLWHAISNR